MKENMELERKDLAIDRDMEVDCDIGQQITCYIETWFDVDESSVSGPMPTKAHG